MLEALSQLYRHVKTGQRTATTDTNDDEEALGLLRKNLPALRCFGLPSEASSMTRYFHLLG
jgi:hypothetical protein